MNKPNIFFRFKEPVKLETIIKETKTTHSISNDNSKIKEYMSSKAIQFINYHNKSLEIGEYQIYTLTALPRYLFLLILTKSNTNHPYLMFINLDDNILNFLLPIGKEKKQTDISEYLDALNKCTIPELSAIYILVEKTIYIRQQGVINSKQFSLLNCNNITPCVKQKRIIEKKQMSPREKESIFNKYNELYLAKATELLKHYFKLLDNKEFEEAYLFLKGDNSKKYFGKQRLNNFFKNTKAIIGHLEIFIALYELFFTVQMKILKH